MCIGQSITKPFHNTGTILATILIIPSHEIGDLTDLLRSERSRLRIVRTGLHSTERHDESVEYFLGSIQYRECFGTLRSLFCIISECRNRRGGRTSHM